MTSETDGAKADQNDLSKSPRGDHRCPLCKVHKNFCFCPYLKKIKTETAVDIIMHHKEKNLTSNTANLALLTLENARVHLRGLPGKVFEVGSIFLKDHNPIYLYPLENSIPLTQEFIRELKSKDPRPLQLIAPDGSWRQARKVIDREKELQSIPCVSLRGLPPSKYLLRREHLSDGMATFEAIAHALTVIEGAEKTAPLFIDFDIMVEQNLKERGKFPWNKNTCAPSISRK